MAVRRMPTRSSSPFRASASSTASRHLVLGGLGSRLNLTLEQPRGPPARARQPVRADATAEGDVTLPHPSREGTIETEVGPFPARSRDELGAESGGVGLRRILETVSDGVELGERDGDGVGHADQGVDGAGQ